MRGRSTGCCGRAPGPTGWPPARSVSEPALPGPRQGSEPPDQLGAVGRVESQEGLELGARGLEFSQAEIAPDEELAGFEVGRIEPEGLAAGGGGGRPVASI